MNVTLPEVVHTKPTSRSIGTSEVSSLRGSYAEKTRLFHKESQDVDSDASCAAISINRASRVEGDRLLIARALEICCRHSGKRDVWKSLMIRDEADIRTPDLLRR